APTVLASLTKLKSLDISYNDLGEFNLDISALRQLENLDLESTKISVLNDVICTLTSLKRLDLGRNCIESLPDGFQNLSNLKALWLNDNKFTSFPVGICKLRSLETLSISFNKIHNLPNAIAYLDNLKLLELDDCGLVGMMPLSICMLRSLKWLSLGQNNLTKLPAVLRTSLQNLTVINLANNDNLQMPPVSVYKRGIKAIFNYIDESETKKTIYQKLVFLGNVRAGKSSLTKTMIQGSSHLSEDSERTIVLDKILWTPEENLSLQVYDFGGSEWYCVVQHFFLEKNSLVCLVISLTDYTEETYIDCVEKWLKIIQARAPGANLFVVTTHTDEVPSQEVLTKKSSILELMHTREQLEVSHINEEITRLQVRGKEAATAIDRLNKSLNNRLVLPNNVYAVSSKTLANIDQLKGHLLKTAKEVGGIIPTSWLRLYDKLHSSELSRNKSFLTFQDVVQMEKETNEDFQARNVLSPSTYRKHLPLKLHHSLNKPRTVTFLSDHFSRPLPTENDEKRTLHRMLTIPDEMNDHGRRTSCLTSSLNNRLQNILSFFHSIGDVLWYEGNPEIRDFVFHKQAFIIDLLKCIFSENPENVPIVPTCLKRGITSKSLERAKEDLRLKGIMSVELLKGMLDHLKLNDKLIDAIVQLLIHFGLCFKEEVRYNRITKLHFPWFLSESAPPDASSMLMQPPESNCWRFILEYNFPLGSPRALFETASVHIHRVVHDEMSIKHWKDGVHARLQHSKILLHRSETCGTETISFHVEGKDINELWKILTQLHTLFSNLLDCWPGVLLEMWLVCPHCTRNDVKNPYRFKGENVEKCCPENEDHVTCPNDERGGSIPVNLIYPMQASASANVVTQDEISKVAYMIGSEWRSLGRALGLDEYVLDHIDYDNRQVQEKACQMMREWKQRKGVTAHFNRLITALRLDLQKTDIVDELIRQNRGNELEASFSGPSRLDMTDPSE
ncbi:hypothetical protein QZH41_017848, partial [Actinostola sp. cb2023]